MVKLEEFYLEVRADLQYYGCLSSEDMKEILIENDIWLHSYDVELKTLPKSIEDCQVELYEAHISFRKIDYVRKKLSIIRKRLIFLFSILSNYVYYTCEGIADYLRNKRYISYCLGDENAPNDLLEKGLGEYNTSLLNDELARKIAKTREWRSLWVDYKTLNSYPFSPANLTVNQRMLISWSRFYDNVYESVECPNEVVLNDDDMLDGWAISQHRKVLREKQSRELESRGTKGNEMFIVAGTDDDIRRINNLNDAEANNIRRQRQVAINKLGVVAEEKLPDAKLRMLEQLKNK